MKDFSPIQIIDLRLQVDQTNPMKTQLFDYRADPANARLLIVLIWQKGN